MQSREYNVQEKITGFWDIVAPHYEGDPVNVPIPGSAEAEAWYRAIERLLPAPPVDVLDIGTGTGFVALIAARLGHRVTGLDLSTAMLAAARAQAAQLNLSIAFHIGDAVAPPIAEASQDVVICRHLLWTLRQPEIALAHWRRILRPAGRVILIDGFWFAEPRPEEEFDLFRRHYSERTRAALPGMRWQHAETVKALLETAGFSAIGVGDLADVHSVADHPGSALPWYVVTGRS